MKQEHGFYWKGSLVATILLPVLLCTMALTGYADAKDGDALPTPSMTQALQSTENSKQTELIPTPSPTKTPETTEVLKQSPVQESTKQTAAVSDVVYETTYSRVSGMSDFDSFMLSRCMNQKTLTTEKVRHLPVILVSSVEELDAFLAETKQFTFRTLQNNGTAFLPNDIDIFTKYDKTFFSSHSLLLVYMQETSGSYRQAVKSVSLSDGCLTAAVEEIIPSGAHTCDMADWLIVAPLNAEQTKGVQNFDAYVLPQQ